MIDLNTRRKYAELLRHFAAGRITNDEYEDEYFEIADCDDVVDEIYNCVWYYYCDMKEHCLENEYRLTPIQRQTFAMWILFLHTDNNFSSPNYTVTDAVQDIEWLCRYILPFFAFKIAMIAVLVTNAINHSIQSFSRPFSKEEDITEELAFWPFKCAEDFQEAVNSPRLLSGLAA